MKLLAPLPSPLRSHQFPALTGSRPFLLRVTMHTLCCLLLT